MKTYNGYKTEGPGPQTVKVSEDGKFVRDLDPSPSQRIRNHSPDGFQWGYGGSGPAQLALALVLDLGVESSVAQSIYQNFKWEVVARLPFVWEKSETELMEVVTKLIKANDKKDG